MSAPDDSPSGRDQAGGPPADEAAAAVPCSACRGTGNVISNLGGTATTVPCPWCEGGGVRLRDHDAQAAKLADREAEGGGEPDTGEAPVPLPEPEPEPPDRVA